MSSSSNNTRAGNAAHVASGKRKITGDEVGSSSKRVALELIPTHPNHDANVGLKNQSGTSFPNCGPYETSVQSVPRETPEDPFYRFLKSQYDTMRVTCKQYLNNKYNDLARQAEHRASTICREKDLEMADLKNMISCFQEKLASKNEVIDQKNTELDNIRRRNIELEEQVEQYKSQVEIWKVKVEKAKRCCGMPHLVLDARPLAAVKMRRIPLCRPWGRRGRIELWKANRGFCVFVRPKSHTNVEIDISCCTNDFCFYNRI
ncbi:hypothetical protein POM88_027730 [Heracleum sosnowskyi]|uniref:Uncharacterized protein n=1 Tax=Heracleum sosnowskyi TaxID=360622 RepID=A0AAD8MPT6_9APIA|nr:hypothetical protein POM88_027730 [Heracleum sosnowskyi]